MFMQSVTLLSYSPMCDPKLIICVKFCMFSSCSSRWTGFAKLSQGVTVSSFRTESKIQGVLMQLLLCSFQVDQSPGGTNPDLPFLGRVEPKVQEILIQLLLPRHSGEQCTLVSNCLASILPRIGSGSILTLRGIKMNK